MIGERHEEGVERVVNAKRTQISCSSQVLEKNIREDDSVGSVVAMMQIANSGHGENSTVNRGIHFHRTSGRRSLAQCLMGSIFMVVADLLTHEAFQITLIENDDMIEQVPAAVTDPAFCNAVLSRASEAGSHRLDTQGFDRVDHVNIEGR